MISLLTASIPRRYSMLCEAIDSVNQQTVKPDFHFISIGHIGQDAPEQFNHLAHGVETEWMTFLDDDDILMPDHIETLKSAMTPDVDVVFTGCQSTGGYLFTQYNDEYSDDILRQRSCVPITGAIRTELFHKIGGFPSDVHYYDWQMWRNALEAGGRFQQIKKITWIYRFHNANRSREGVNA